MSITLVFAVALGSGDNLRFGIMRFAGRRDGVLTKTMVLILTNTLIMGTVPSVVTLFSTKTNAIFNLLVRTLWVMGRWGER